MAEVNYKLSEGTREAVREAGVDGSGAREHLAKAQKAQAYQGGVNEIYKGVEAIKEENKKKKEGDLDAEEAWDTGFDAMGDRGSWASGELFDQFQTMEAGYRDEYLEAVRKGDTKLQKRLLKDQGSRSSGLQGWKGTMETALKIHKEYGWGEVIKGDTPEAQRKRDILLAMSKMDSSTTVKMGGDGEMVFNIPGVGDVTRREVDEMVAAGAAPIMREEAFMASSLSVRDAGAAGKSFNKNSNHYMHRKAYAKELRANPDAATSILDDIYSGSETSLAQDLEAGIKDGGAIKFSVKLPKDKDGNVLGYDPNGDGVLNEKDLVDVDIKELIKALKADPKILAEVAADWQTQIEENIYDTAKAEYSQTIENKRFNSMGKDAQAVELQSKRDGIATEGMTPEQRREYYLK